MDALYCPHCGLEQPIEHMFCLRCGVRVPKEVLNGPAKSSRWFAGVKVGEGDPEGAYLRVSCYRDEQVFHAPEGQVRIPGHHVRFSVWIGEEAKCVLSIAESEARELSEFLEVNMGPHSNGESKELSAQ